MWEWHGKSTFLGTTGSWAGLLLSAVLLSGSVAFAGAPLTDAGDSLASPVPALHLSAPPGLQSGESPQSTASYLRGIDVASWQGKPDWTRVYGSGIRLAFAKATQGTGYTNPYFTYDMGNGGAAGVYMGAYDFACPITDSRRYCSASSATDEANHFVSVAGRYFKAGYMYPALDLEVGCSSLGKHKLTLWAQAWSTAVQSYISRNAGYDIVPILYTGAWSAANCVESSITSYFSLWVANWGVTSPSTGVWGSWAFWQYTNCGSVPGINGCVDMDYFHGGVSGLRSGYVFGGPPLSGSYSVRDTTTGTALSCGGSFLTEDNVRFTASPAGGSPPYTYSWDFGDGTKGTGSPVNHIYSTTGTVHTILTITDSIGNPYLAGQGCPFTVNPGLALSSPLTASPNPVTVGTTTTLSVAASGGSTPYSYSYAGLPSGCSTSDTATLSCTPSAIGSFRMSVTIADAQGRTASSSTTLVVSPTTLAVSSFVANPSTLTVNSATALSMVVSGGLQPYMYSYAGLPPGCVSADAASLTCTPNAIGSYSITVTVTDGGGQMAQATTSLVVVATLSITAFRATPNRITLGDTTDLTVIASGGAGSLTYVYAGLPAGCVSQDLPTLRCTPTRFGTFNVSVSVTDTLGEHQSNSITLDVEPASPEFTNSSAGIALAVGIAVAAAAAFAVTIIARKRRNR